VRALEIASSTLSIVYAGRGVLSGVDNVFVSTAGDVIVAEDGGDLQIVAITPAGNLVPLIQLVGHSSSEITGPAFDATGTRLYFSSQRGTSGSSNDGMTFEVSGPFFV
jgi:secreted PhoX family phosphatase